MARRFWNQILTCVSVSLSEAENSARSAMLRYCLARNFFSRAESCCVVKGVRGFRLGLCFRSVPILMGPVGGFSVMSVMTKDRNLLVIYTLKIASALPAVGG